MLVIDLSLRFASLVTELRLVADVMASGEEMPFFFLSFPKKLWLYNYSLTKEIWFIAELQESIFKAGGGSGGSQEHHLPSLLPPA